jgi:hypothetical protein
MQEKVKEAISVFLSKASRQGWLRCRREAACGQFSGKVCSSGTICQIEIIRANVSAACLAPLRTLEFDSNERRQLNAPNQCFGYEYSRQNLDSLIAVHAAEIDCPKIQSIYKKYMVPRRKLCGCPGLAQGEGNCE